MGGKKALLVISFGTSYEETREKTIGACEKALSLSFPDYDLKRAFTSRFIIRKLARRDGLAVDTPVMAVERLLQEQYDQVLIQPLTILSGQEYSRKILHPLFPFRKYFRSFTLGEPLIYHDRDYDALLDALEGQVPSLESDEALVFMGHGSDSPANAVYSCLQLKARDRDLPWEIGCVEGYPGPEILLNNLKKRNVRRVHLMPLMLVAGDHARNDMAGDDPESWRSLFSAAGYEVECHLSGLGENPQIQQIFCRKAREAFNPPS